MSERPSRPRKLAKADDLSVFSSGAAELDSWLHDYAWENQRANNATTYVSLSQGKVAGYYSIAAGGVELGAVPSDVKKGTRPNPLPVIILARLAVDSQAAGTGLGAALLSDALERAAMASESLGAAALLVHARDSVARSFYLHLGDFIESPLDDLQLMVSMKRVRAEFLK